VAPMRTGLNDIFTTFVDDDVPVAFRGYDGTVTGPRSPIATVEVRSPAALGYIVTAPGELGVARAYVTGAIEVHGDLHAALRVLHEHRRRDITPRQLLRLARGIDPRLLRRPRVPLEEAVPGWRRGLVRHTRRRDAAAIARHYDVSNRFYELVLGRSMAYSCAVFRAAATPLDEAQTEKFDLVCRKLDLRPGQCLLDVGAGWGGLVRHAAAHYGVKAIGVTLSQAQVEWAQRANAQAGLARSVQIFRLDYRDLPSRAFDAICSIGAMEHFGSSELGRYFGSMAGHLRPGGRMLNHCITRPSNREGHRPGPFIDRYVFPDGELQGPGTIIAAMHDHGLEVRHTENLREHYALTLREWGANLERCWRQAVAEVGERRARVWRLYMALSRIGFETDRVQIHQMLGVRLDARGRSEMPLRPAWEHHGQRAGTRTTELAANGTGFRVTESPRRDSVLSTDLGDAVRSVRR
jgi:cyclopropane-fatty-acyl-phospholipid synthase